MPADTGEGVADVDAVGAVLPAEAWPQPAAADTPIATQDATTVRSVVSITRRLTGPGRGAERYNGIRCMVTSVDITARRPGAGSP
jgi:hypothetical protein